MKTDYSSITLHIPSGYYTRNLALMATVEEKFGSMKICQGEIGSVSVFCEVECDLSREVAAWVGHHLPTD